MVKAIRRMNFITAGLQRLCLCQSFMLVLSVLVGVAVYFTLVLFAPSLLNVVSKDSPYFLFVYAMQSSISLLLSIAAALLVKRPSSRASTKRDDRRRWKPLLTAAALVAGIAVYFPTQLLTQFALAAILEHNPTSPFLYFLADQLTPLVLAIVTAMYITNRTHSRSSIVGGVRP